MLFCPLQSQGLLHRRPKVTQVFGVNAHRYPNNKGYGHSGIDYHTWVGRTVFAPFGGTIRVMDRGDESYGLHVRIRNKYGMEAVLAHLSGEFVEDGQEVEALHKIGMVGNSGKSRKAHLHFGLKLIVPSNKDIYEWKNKKSDVSAFGYIDPLPLVVNWKGGHLSDYL